jgi:hypothetical protein
MLRVFLLWIPIKDVFLVIKREFHKRANRFAALAHIVGWVKRDAGTIFVGFAYLNLP